GLLQLSRRSISPAIGVASALAVWALAAWIARVPWPLANDRAFVLGREDASWLAPPAPFVLGLFAAAVAVLASWPWLRPPRAARGRCRWSADEHAPAHVRNRPRLADRGRRVVLLSARHAARRAHRAKRQLDRIADPLCRADAVRHSGADRRDVRNARHGTAA